MLLYFHLLRFSFLRFFAYPYEILAALLRNGLEIAFLIFAWSLFNQYSNNALSINTLASYFLLASGIDVLVMAQWGRFGGSLGKAIRFGTISNYLLKPVNILPTFYSTALGSDGINVFFSICTIFLGLYIQPPQSLLSVGLFVYFFINAIFIAYAYNILEATMFFYVPDANGIRGSMQHIIGLLSGLLVPIYFFPHPLDQFIKLTPFPGMIFGPINALKTNAINSTVMTDMSVVLFWSITLNILALLFWRRSLKRYEAVGI